nr:uncharacterized protein LOC109192699 isoform X2 [Ipomoea batatas]
MDLCRRHYRSRAPSPSPSQQSSVAGAIAAELRRRRHRSRAPSPSPLQQSSVAVAIAADRTPPSTKQSSGVEGTGMNIKLESLRKENMDLLEKIESLEQELGSVKLKCSMKQSKGVFAIEGTPK